MNVIYKEIPILYREKENDWIFTIGGRERTASSLALAKEKIDKPPSAKDKTFERTRCHFDSKWEGWQIFEVTSLAAERYSNEPTDAWCTGPNGRRKETMRYLYPVNPHNDALVSQMKTIDDQIKALQEDRAKLLSKLKHLADQVRSK